MDNCIPDDLPTIGPNDTFRFACGPNLPCFNRCCAQLSMPLTPYDILRLKRNLELPAPEVLRMFTTMQKDEETGLPIFLLRMIESVEAPCPFLTPAGCSVYDDRPGACRSYPLGRGARIGLDGVCERFFIVREDHCRGFDSGPERTPNEWFAEEGLASYIRFNDMYMRLLSLLRASGKPLDTRLSGMATLCLWQLDKFGEFVEKMELFTKVNGPATENPAFGRNDLAGDEALLELGMNWLELITFGNAPGLKRKE